ncbi:MAG: hypothetical protein P1V20_06865 [Verrucomicrobiales bacterium]|nr:hypothetical protein [Verrucomicrobiales bacterium]
MIALCLAVFLAGGGRICVHQLLPTGSEHVHSCSHGHDHEDCDHGESEESSGRCNCDAEGFVIDLPPIIELACPGIVSVFLHSCIDSLCSGVNSEERWKHPPPRLYRLQQLSLPSLQRYNV